MIKKIVLTGGPKSGKTDTIKYLDKYYKDLGYNVILIEESVTYLKSFGNKNDFEKLKMQFNNEDIDRWINMLKIDNTLIICERSVIEVKDYQNNYLELLNKYDLVINLVGSKEDVSESLEKANNNLHVILPQKTIEEKVNLVIKIINENIQDYKEKRQEKYLINIENSDIEKIKEISNKMHITQDYLISDFNYEERVRKVEWQNNIIYYHSIYKLVDNNTIKILEEEIDLNNYQELLKRKDNSYETIEKDCYSFAYEDEYLYLDVFDGLSILEVNGLDDYYVKIPPYLDVLKKVSGDKKYSNKYLARKR